MRTFVYDAIRQEVLARSAAVRVGVALDLRRDQVHDDEQWQALMRQDLDRLQRWLKTGKLRILGPRRFALA